MSIECRHERGRLTVFFKGDIDEFACRTLRTELDAEMEREKPREVVFDLKDDTPLHRRNAPEFKTYFQLIWKELNSHA